MINLTKLHKIHKFLRDASLLDFRKFSKESVVTSELLDRYRQGDMDAANMIAREILKHVHGAMKHYNIMEQVSPQEWKDFRDKTAERIWSYSVPRYDPEIAQFSSFVFNMTMNMWKNWQQSKSTKPLDQSVSMDEPLDSADPSDTSTAHSQFEDPLALDFKSEIEAQFIEKALLENIKNPRHQEILSLWLNEDPAMGPKLRAKEVAEAYNKAHPEDKPMQDYRIYRIMLDDIFPLVLDKFPDMAGMVGYEKNPDPELKPWQKKPPRERTVEDMPEDAPGEPEYVPYTEPVAPVYRIDPNTGERTLISLNMKRRQITAAQEILCHNLMTFLSIVRYGKFRRTTKISTTR